MTGIQDFISKIDKIAKREDNVKFMPVTKSTLQNHTKMEGLEDYKEIKEMVEEWECGLENCGRQGVVVPIPVRSKD